MTDEQIVVVPFDPEWSLRFEAERSVLERVLAPWFKDGIHHVGSTAVPGLGAKPIIDIVAGVRDLDQARASFESLREASYVYSPHRPGIAHHFVKRPRLPELTCGLHLTEPGSDLWRERLAFRDALRQDAELAVDYEALKQRLAQSTRTTRRRIRQASEHSSRAFWQVWGRLSAADNVR